MASSTGTLTLSQLHAKELAGKHWALNGGGYTFADYDRGEPGQPPWKTGAEGIAYPLLGGDGRARAYVKFFDELKVSPKRIERTKWLIEQRIDNWAAELRGAPNSWVDTKALGLPAAISFDFTCSLAQAVPGKTWLEVKLDVIDGGVRLHEELRCRCVENLIRGLVYLERAGVVHGDLSPNNVIVNIDAGPDEPALYLIDFDGFVAPHAGQLAQLTVGEGGTFGTRGYCPPDLEQRAQQNALSAAPYSDRYARDILLIELLCFDKDCDFEEPASQWRRDKIQWALLQSQMGERLQHMNAEDVFRQPEDRRPSSYELARTLHLATPPRVKGRQANPHTFSTGGLGRTMVPGEVHACLRTGVLVLWVLCVVHWGLVSFWGARWLVSPSASTGGGSAAEWLLVAAQVLLGLGFSVVGVVGLSLLAFADDQPRLINFQGVWLRIPARRNQTRPYAHHLGIVAVQLLGILVVLASVAILVARHT